MTNYNKWANFDADRVLQEQERRDAIEETNLQRKIDNLKATQKITESLTQAQKDAEIMSSKSAVEALKAARKSRPKRNVTTSTAPVESDKAPMGASESTSPEQCLLALTNFLMTLVAEVEKLQGQTVKNTDHWRGLHLATRCLQGMATLNTVQRMLLSSRLKSTSRLHNILPDLENAETSLRSQTITCMSLFSLSTGSFAYSAEASRHILRSQGAEADAGLWIMRGLAFAGMGVAHICHLHFQTAQSKNANYPGLSTIMPYLLDTEAASAQQWLSRSCIELVQLELDRALYFVFESHAAFLEEFGDISCVTLSDLQYLFTPPGLIPSSTTTVGSCTMSKGVSVENKEELHLDIADDFFDDQPLSVEQIEHDVVSSSRFHHIVHDKVRVYGERLSGNRRTKRSQFQAYFQAMHTSGPVDTSSSSIQQELVAVMCLVLSHRLFYEGQVMYLEGMYRAAEVKYATCLVFLRELLDSDATAVVDLKAYLAAGLRRLTDSNLNSSSFATTDISAFLEYWLATILSNIACCRLQRQRFQGYSDASHVNSFTTARTPDQIVQALESLSALAIAQLASSLSTSYHDSEDSSSLPKSETFLFRQREVEILEKMYRFRDALRVLASLEEAIKQRALDSSVVPKGFVVARYAGHVLSQLFLAGKMHYMATEDALAPSKTTTNADETITASSVAEADVDAQLMRAILDLIQKPPYEEDLSREVEALLPSTVDTPSAASLGTSQRPQSDAQLTQTDLLTYIAHKRRKLLFLIEQYDE